MGYKEKDKQKVRQKMGFKEQDKQKVRQKWIQRER